MPDLATRCPGRLRPWPHDCRRCAGRGATAAGAEPEVPMEELGGCRAVGAAPALEGPEQRGGMEPLPASSWDDLGGSKGGDGELRSKAPGS